MAPDGGGWQRDGHGAAVIGDVVSLPSGDRPLVTVAVCGGTGDTCLDGAARSRVDAYVTAVVRHHPAIAHVAGGAPALIAASHGTTLTDASHGTTERPWLDDVAGSVRARTGPAVTVLDLAADPWASHVPSVLTAKEQRL
jgi:putative NIF3 family GTP cyclohydrolase 1 type 2